MPANPVFHILRAIYIEHNDNDDNVGYVLEENPEVDPILFTKVREINDSLVLPDEEGPILRYQPLHDGSHFLFSVIYPQKPNANHDRIYDVAVHFLMNEDAASNFFSYDFLETTRCAKQFSSSCLENQAGALEIPADLREYFTKPTAPAFQTKPDDQFPDAHKLLLQAADACLSQKSNYSPFYLYFPKNNSVEILADLIGLVPPFLRHKLSFQSCFPLSYEGQPADDPNIVIRFPNQATNRHKINPFMSQLLSVPQKIELYKHIKYLINDWQEFKELGLLIKNGKKPRLRKVLKVFKESEILDYINNRPICHLSEEEKALLLEAIKKSHPIPDLFPRRRDQRRTRPAAAPAVQSQDQHHSESSAVPAVQPQDQHHSESSAVPAVQPQDQPHSESSAVPAVRTRTANRSRGSLPLLLLLLAVFVMSTALVLIGASRWWSVLSIFTGPAFGGYLVWNWKPHRR